MPSAVVVMAKSVAGYQFRLLHSILLPPTSPYPHSAVAPDSMMLGLCIAHEVYDRLERVRTFLDVLAVGRCKGPRQLFHLSIVVVR